MKKNYFEGWYFKHQKQDETICFIVGKGGESSFIQIITNDFSKTVYYDAEDYKVARHFEQIRVGKSVFSKNGCIVDINDGDLVICGRLSYVGITPVKNDVMGIFKHFPRMECYHGVVSLDHGIHGSLIINGHEHDFTGGKGYIEKDYGTSFPKSYFWCQCNDFDTKTSIMIAVAKIPYLGLTFNGIICCVYFHGKEYRLATYKGARIKEMSQDKIVIGQGKYTLEAHVSPGTEYPLAAPKGGMMERTIYEAINADVHFKMFESGLPIFNIKSSGACVERVYTDGACA